MILCDLWMKFRKRQRARKFLRQQEQRMDEMRLLVAEACLRRGDTIFAHTDDEGTLIIDPPEEPS